MEATPNQTNKTQAMQEIAFNTSLFVKSADYKNIYSNQVQIAVTPNDFQISLSQSTAPGGVASNEIQATVILAPMQAKIFSDLMQRVIADYEQKHGVIPVANQAIVPMTDNHVIKK